jgi:hypothetical protein
MHLLTFAPSRPLRPLREIYFRLGNGLSLRLASSLSPLPPVSSEYRPSIQAVQGRTAVPSLRRTGSQ